LWHFADKRCAAKLVAFWSNNGQTSILIGPDNDVNDPKRS
jgi:hypothetical protein